jgi:hypothetical protein
MTRSSGFVISIQQRHNRANGLKASGFLLLSAVFWVMSYWVFKILAMLPLFLCGWSHPDKISSAVAWGCLGLLAIEGVLYGRRVSSLAEASRSFYF